jgi:hypothetical protein
MNKKILLPIFLLLIVSLACGSLPQNGEPTPEEEIDAKEVIQTYASDVLGLEIPRLLAGGASGEINLPVNLQNDVEVALDLAGTTYFGVWSGGIASLSFGDSNVSGDFEADVRDGALGVFAITAYSALPEDSDTALNMILETYPALVNYQWIETPSEQGYTFTTGETDHVSVQSWSVELTGTTIQAGAAPGVIPDQSFVWVVVASGVLAAPFQQ